MSFGFVGFCYWLLPEYSGSFYDKFYQLIWDYGLYVLLATPFYVRWVSERDGELEDSYYQL
ncbi:MAG: hypothetical protein OIF35_01050, partial [Cellvibrionaceae bacterium]|nr:hypothetical protein [Cellvibrionaceae bacterium]